MDKNLLMNKNLLIIIILLISCYIILKIKENYQTASGVKIGTEYYDYIDNFYFVGQNLENNNGVKNLQTINTKNVSDLGLCMEECENDDNCYSFKFNNSSGQKSCNFYSNKVLSNDIINDIQSCTAASCYFNKKNGIARPYDDLNQTKKFYKNETACHPADRTNYLINNINETLSAQGNDGHIKQCANKCRENAECKSFIVYNNVSQPGTNEPTFSCKYYKEPCLQGTNTSNVLEKDDVYASYDIYDCGEFECRKVLNGSGSSDDKWNIYCNNNKYTSSDFTNEFDTSEKCNEKKTELIADNIICQKDCDSGGGILFDDATISIAPKELPPIYYY